MRKTITLVAFCAAAMLAVTSCDAPGRLAVETVAIRPADIADFRVLYSQNCSGCHGANGQGALTVGIGTARVSCHRRRCHNPQNDRAGQARNPDVRFCAEGGRHADRCSDRHSGSRNSELGRARRFREYKASGLSQRRSPATRRAGPNYSRFHALCVTVPKAAARALSPTRHSWLWSPISICAP